jgi:hypothetical protein
VYSLKDEPVVDMGNGHNNREKRPSTKSERWIHNLMGRPLPIVRKKEKEEDQINNKSKSKNDSLSPHTS